MKTILNVEGMMCQNCERHVNEAIRKNFDVESVSSDHKKNETVVISAAPLDHEKLYQVIADEDYELKGITEE
ncbi:MAG: heavy-metal-associated domain-containing protein [Lachnospiraceae bacterium]|nr:heavy-metal-associated domain-containing protein [Lachnospiraceae bacterium]